MNFQIKSDRGGGGGLKSQNFINSSIYMCQLQHSQEDAQPSFCIIVGSGTKQIDLSYGVKKCNFDGSKPETET